MRDHRVAATQARDCAVAIRRGLQARQALLASASAAAEERRFEPPCCSVVEAGAEMVMGSEGGRPTHSPAEAAVVRYSEEATAIRPSTGTAPLGGWRPRAPPAASGGNEQFRLAIGRVRR